MSSAEGLVTHGGNTGTLRLSRTTAVGSLEGKVRYELLDYNNDNDDDDDHHHINNINNNNNNNSNNNDDDDDEDECISRTPFQVKMLNNAKHEQIQKIQNKCI